MLSMQNMKDMLMNTDAQGYKSNSRLMTLQWYAGYTVFYSVSAVNASGAGELEHPGCLSNPGNLIALSSG